MQSGLSGKASTVAGNAARKQKVFFIFKIKTPYTVLHLGMHMATNFPDSYTEILIITSQHVHEQKTLKKPPELSTISSLRLKCLKPKFCIYLEAI